MTPVKPDGQAGDDRPDVATDADRRDRDIAWRQRHGEQVSAVDRDDPRQVKQLYVEMGRFLHESFADDIDGTPQLSLAETTPVVTSLLRGARGVILDAGCGPNPVASLALLDEDPDRAVVALDLGFGTVHLARARATRDGRCLHGVVGDLERLPFRAGVFTGIVCDDTIEHVPDDALAARELMRVTAAGGRVVLATPNRWSLAIIRRKLRDRRHRRPRPASHYFVAKSHLREYTWRELERLVAPVARIEQRESVGWSGGWRSRAASWVTRRPVGRQLDRMIVVRLRHR